jgi:putative two-component system response regulator
MDRTDQPIDVRDAAILIVDDDQSIVKLLQSVLEADGYTRVRSTPDPAAAGPMAEEVPPDLVLLDRHMPGIDGFQLIEQLNAAAGADRELPILMLTADDADETKRRALALGARDIITKPFDQTELLLRVRNLIEVQKLHARTREHNVTLEQDVAERTRDLELAQLEMLERLALAAEFRDDATQEHARRIGRSCAQIAEALGLPEPEVERLGRAAQLHDIGKIGLPDAILLKPGLLTKAEFEQVKVHTVIGAQMLSGSSSPILQLAEEIALTHHERWDGCGYPNGLRSTSIPLSGRITAIADVFDALCHPRPYKQAWPVAQALNEIVCQAGRDFDPDLVAAFAELDHSTLIAEPQAQAEPQPEVELELERPTQLSRFRSGLRVGSGALGRDRAPA